MTTLDRSLITKRIEVLALKVPKQRTGEYLKKLRPYLLNMPRQRNAIDGAEQTKLILLEGKVPQDDWLEKELAAGVAETTDFAFDVGYDYFTADEAFKILGIEAMSSFEQAGHVVHLNLRPEHEKNKFIIAQIVLDKTNRCRTVVNKVGDISSVYRTYPLEVLAGDDDTRVSLKESDCYFEFDIRDVYWNSRLQTEHGRIVDLLSSKDIIVADATAGVGPFAVPLAKRGVSVLANDLNPACVDALRDNRRRNDIADDVLLVDGPGCAKSFLRRHSSYTHVLLNLPAAGIDLLSAFRGLSLTPMVFCYCFGPKTDPQALFENLGARLKAALGVDPPPFAVHEPDDPVFPSTAVQDAYTAASSHTSVRWIRNVAPAKEMFCLAFRVPPGCADLVYDEEESRDVKRLKTV